MRIPGLGGSRRHHRRGCQRFGRSGHVLMNTMRSTVEHGPYADEAQITFLGKRLNILDLSREISPSIPVYPGHMKVSFWNHLTHDESRLRLGGGPFRGYAVS